MAIDTHTKLLSALAGRQRILMEKSSGAGTNTETNAKSMWRAAAANSDGIWPTAVAPVSEALTRSTVGAIPLPDVLAGNTLYLAGVRFQQLGTGSEDPQQLVIADRLSQVGGLSGTVTTAQTVNTPALPRYTDGKHVQAWAEINTAIGTTATSATCSYTNQDGVAGRTGTINPIGGAGQNDATAMMRMQLQSGDYGVRSVETFTLAASTATAGNIAIVLVKPLCHLHRREWNAGRFDWLDLGLPRVDPDACLFMHVVPTTFLRATNAFVMDWIQG